MKSNFSKLVAVVALAALVLPALASAQTATGVKAEVRTDVEVRTTAATPNRGEAATSTALMRAAQTVTNQATQVQKAADLMAAMSLKLSLRIASSTATTSDIAAANAAFADLGTQLADARLQATAAFGHIASATAASSTKANTNAELKKARADIVVARKDLEVARKDIDKIMKILRVRKAGDTNTTSSVKVETR